MECLNESQFEPSNSHNSVRKKAGDTWKTKINSNKINKLQNAQKFSPNSVRKKIKSIQSSTINNWLTKDLTSKKSSLGSNMKLKSDKITQNSNNANSPFNERSCESSKSLSSTEQFSKNSGDVDMEIEKQYEKEASSSNNNMKPLEERIKKKKKSHRRRSQKETNLSKEEFSDNIDNNEKLKEEISTSEIKNTCVVQDKSEDKEAMKKFKKITTSPLSLDNVVVKNEKKNSASPQTNTISKWLSKSDRNILNVSNNDTKKNFHKKKFEENNGNKTNTKSKETLKSKCEENGTMELSRKVNSSVSEAKRREEKTQVTTHTRQKMKTTDLEKSPSRTKSKHPIRTVPVARKLFDVDLFSQSDTKRTFSHKDTDITQNKHFSKYPKNSTIDVSNFSDANKTGNRCNKLDIKNNSNKSKEVYEKTLKKKKKKKPPAQTLDSYLSQDSKASTKRKFSRGDSNETCAVAKTSKRSKMDKISDSFKKYGVAVPSLEEIMRDEKDFVEYKNQIESFADIEDHFLELPFSINDIKKNSPIKENILGCKHLSIQGVEENFNNNLDYISAIFHGKRYSERHKRFFDNSIRSCTFTVKDLSYNTSTIVFSFEQIEHMIALLKKEFDPNDKWTSYFFQVLLPELCLKIFMDTHNMTYEEAVKYLDTRPIVD